MLFRNVFLCKWICEYGLRFFRTLSSEDGWSEGISLSSDGEPSLKTTKSWPLNKCSQIKWSDVLAMHYWNSINKSIWNAYMHTLIFFTDQNLNPAFVFPSLEFPRLVIVVVVTAAIAADGVAAVTGAFEESSTHYKSGADTGTRTATHRAAAYHSK